MWFTIEKLPPVLRESDTEGYYKGNVGFPQINLVAIKQVRRAVLLHMFHAIFEYRINNKR